MTLIKSISSTESIPVRGCPGMMKKLTEGEMIPPKGVSVKDEVLEGGVDFLFEPNKECGMRFPMRLYFWFTDTESEVVMGEITKSQSGIILGGTPEKGVKITVTFDSYKYDIGILKARLPPSICPGCKKHRLLPQLAMMWYTPGEEGRGDIFTGAVKFEIDHAGEKKKKKIENYALAYYKHGNYPCELEGYLPMGYMTILTSFFPLFSTFKEYETHPEDNALVKWGIQNEGQLKRKSYRAQKDELVQQSFIATMFGLIPRELYYLDATTDMIRITDAWITAQLMFSFKLAGVGLGDVSGLAWNHTMHLIIRAFTWFVTRFTYIRDAIVLTEETDGSTFSVVYEQYSGPQMAGAGSYDCEDGAWLLFCMFRHIQSHTGKGEVGGEWIEMASGMLKEYMICNALVTVTNPCIGAKVAKEDLSFGYHETCLLVPRRFLREKMLKVEGEGRDGLSLLIAESTCNTYSSPFERVFTQGNDPLLRKLSAAADGGVVELACIPVHENTLYNNPLYNKILSLASDFGIEKDGTVITELQTGFDSYPTARIEEFKAGQGSDLKVNEIGYSKKDETVVLKNLSLLRRKEPTFVLDMDINMFEKELKKVNAPLSPLKFPTSFFTHVICNKTNCGGGKIPYLPWNLTNRTALPTAQAIHFHAL